MAAAGQDFNQSILVAQKFEVVSQNLFSGIGGASDVSVTTAGPGSMVITRKYRPTWTIVVAVIGVFFYLLGLLALLFTVTEVLTITIRAEQGGTRILISGKSSHEILQRVTAILSAMPTLATNTNSVNESDKSAENGLVTTVDNKVCPECGETIKLAAKICRFCRFEFGNKP